jgi:pimeloyl-ACP methyl ester carboxylesterase
MFRGGGERADRNRLPFQVAEICRNLYKKRPEQVDDRLVYNIVRSDPLPHNPPPLLPLALLPLAFFRSTDLPLPCPTLMWCRDSKDPGALGVFASGGRLPPPRPANELLRKFNGPVLVAQGALDPLNDAKGRAELLRTCYDKTVVRLIEAGHCPHVSTPHPTAEERSTSSPRSCVLSLLCVVCLCQDEDPENVCKAIDEFIQSLQLDDAGLVQGTAPLPAAGAA